MSLEALLALLALTIYVVVATPFMDSMGKFFEGRENLLLN
jgi:hypothetical protein